MFEFPAIPHRSPPTIEIMALVKYLLDIVRARWGRVNACVDPTPAGVDRMVVTVSKAKDVSDRWGCMGFDCHLGVGPRLHRCFGSSPARTCLASLWQTGLVSWLCLPGVKTPGYNIGRPLSRTGDL